MARDIEMAVTIDFHFVDLFFLSLFLGPQLQKQMYTSLQTVVKLFKRPPMKTA